MPIFVYKCRFCKKTYEILVRNEVTDLPWCSTCEETRGQDKQLTAPAHFFGLENLHD